MNAVSLNNLWSYVLTGEEFLVQCQALLDNFAK